MTDWQVQLDGDSTALALARRLAALGVADSRRALKAVLEQLTVEEKAWLARRWEFWARPKQKAPPDSKWRTWGFLSGRGFGKTRAVSEYVLGEIMSGRAMIVGLCAQDEANCIALQILGGSGLVSLSPPWFKGQWVPSLGEIKFPNGAIARVYTPEHPGHEKIRGPEHHLFWCTEFQSWPAPTRDEALSNIRLGTRLGYSRIVWDATPKKRHPIIRDLLADARDYPETHRVVFGSTYENAANLGSGVVQELDRKYRGTAKGLEELLGLFSENNEEALFRIEWIEPYRCWDTDLPKFVYKVVSIDPAVTAKQGSDTTGLVVCGLGSDGRAYVLENRSGKYAVAKWGEAAVEAYLKHGCDFLIAETNKGGDLVIQNLRALAKDRGLSVVEIKKGDRPQKVKGVLYVLPVYAQGSKEDRAEAVATAYESGRVCHVRGHGIESLEETLTTWEPVQAKLYSPGDLDAMVHAVSELLGLREQPKIRRADVQGAALASRKLQTLDLARALSAQISPRGTGGRI
jgi:phage terminase large subunit-like protein